METVKILNSEIDLQDEELTIYHTTLEVNDKRYANIGKKLDKENFNNSCFLVITSMEGNKVQSMDLNYVVNNGDIEEIEPLFKGNELRKMVVEDIVNNLW